MYHDGNVVFSEDKEDLVDEDFGNFVRRLLNLCPLYAY